MNAIKTRPRNPLFLTYPPILASEFRDKLMGACVANPYDPTNDYSSAEGPRAIDVRSEIDPRPVEINNYYSLLNTSSNAGVHATFEKIVNAFFETEADSEVARQAAKAKWWKMETPLKHLERLLADDRYRDSVLELLRRNPGEPVYLVTNMLVLSAPQIDRAQASSTHAGLEAGVPDPHTQGTTNIVELGAEGGHSNESATGGQFMHEMIVGLGVYPIYLSKPKPAGLCGLLQRKNPDPIIRAVPISDRVLRDLRMGHSLARPPDGAQFMSRKKVADETTDEAVARNSEKSLDFALYFPE
jgi:hypothetical protein